MSCIGKRGTELFFIEDIDNHLDDILFYFIKAELHRKKLRNVTLEQFVEMLDAGLRKVIHRKIMCYGNERGYQIESIQINDAELYIRYVKR